MCAPHTTAPSRDRYTHHMKVSMHSLDPTHPTTVPSSRHASYMYPTPIPSIPRIQSILRIPLILHPSHTHRTPIAHPSHTPIPHPSHLSPSQPISAPSHPTAHSPQPTLHTMVCHRRWAAACAVLVVTRATGCTFGGRSASTAISHQATSRNWPTSSDGGWEAAPRTN